MKIFFPCSECLGEKPKLKQIYVSLEIRDDGYYEFTCPSGHKSLVALQQQKFEILYEVGAHAIIDGYYIEAVTSFTAALERFYAFFIEVACKIKKIKPELFQETWGFVANQSERQLGAFIYLYLIIFETTPEILSDENRSFRNSVLHKGKIPNKEDTIKYGQEVLDLIFPVLKELKKEHRKELSATVEKHLNSIWEKKPKGKIMATACEFTILNIAWDKDPESKNLEKEITRIEKYIQYFIKHTQT